MSRTASHLLSALNLSVAHNSAPTAKLPGREVSPEKAIPLKFCKQWVRLDGNCDRLGFKGIKHSGGSDSLFQQGLGAIC